MPFISPMLAQPWTDKVRIAPGTRVAELKYDGHRRIVEVLSGRENLLDEHEKTIRCWSRDGLSNIVPPQIREACAVLPDGTYDGEFLVPGERCYGVKELTKQDKLVFVVFDVLIVQGADLTCDKDWTGKHRRATLEEIFSHPRVQAHSKALQLAESWPVNSNEQAFEIAELVWARGQEGLIIKDLNAIYLPGKRPRTWIKIKQCLPATLTLNRFIYGKRGPCSVLELLDDDGVVVTVKSQKMVDLARFEANPDAFIGRRVCIEYQERTPDGAYREPRFDRFEDE